MARGNIVAGLDIGTHSIKALVAQKKGKDWEVLSYAEIPSFGLRKGAVVSIEETSKNIQLIMSGIEKDCNRKINSVFVNTGISLSFLITDYKKLSSREARNISITNCRTVNVNSVATIIRRIANGIPTLLS